MCVAAIKFRIIWFFFLIMVHFVSLNIFSVFYVPLWIKFGFMGSFWVFSPFSTVTETQFELRIINIQVCILSGAVWGHWLAGLLWSYVSSNSSSSSVTALALLLPLDLIHSHPKTRQETFWSCLDKIVFCVSAVLRQCCVLKMTPIFRIQKLNGSFAWSYVTSWECQTHLTVVSTHWHRRIHHLPCRWGTSTALTGSTVPGKKSSSERGWSVIFHLQTVMKTETGLLCSAYLKLHFRDHIPPPKPFFITCLLVSVLQL